MIVFRDPCVFFVLPVFFLIFFLVRKNTKRPGILFPEEDNIGRLSATLRQMISRKMYLFRIAAIVALVAAIARPQLVERSRIRKEGIAIMIAIDCSSTMVSEGIKLSFQDMAEKGLAGKGKTLRRIDAARRVVKDFIKTRADDIIGVIAFAADAFVVSPPTFDHAWVLKSVDRIEVGMIRDGTAIGSGILSSLNALKDVDSNSRIIILVTDGINNFGKISPMVAAKAARAIGVKIYTIGIIGENGLVNTDDGSGRKIYRSGNIGIDENELKELAVLTGGEYFRASDLEELRDSYDKINKLEKVPLEQENYENRIDLFQNILFVALFILIAGIFLSNTFFRRIP